MFKNVDNNFFSVLLEGKFGFDDITKQDRHNKIISIFDSITNCYLAQVLYEIFNYITKDCNIEIKKMKILYEFFFIPIFVSELVLNDDAILFVNLINQIGLINSKRIIGNRECTLKDILFDINNNTCLMSSNEKFFSTIKIIKKCLKNYNENNINKLYKNVANFDNNVDNLEEELDIGTSNRIKNSFKKLANTEFNNAWSYFYRFIELEGLIDLRPTNNIPNVLNNRIFKYILADIDLKKDSFLKSIVISNITTLCSYSINLLTLLDFKKMVINKSECLHEESHLFNRLCELQDQSKGGKYSCLRNFSVLCSNNMPTCINNYFENKSKKHYFCFILYFLTNPTSVGTDFFNQYILPLYKKICFNDCFYKNIFKLKKCSSKGFIINQNELIYCNHDRVFNSILVEICLREFHTIKEVMDFFSSKSNLSNDNEYKIIGNTNNHHILYDNVSFSIF